MKIKFLAAGATLVALTLSSCMEVSNDITLNKDGSGQITETMVLLPKTVAQIKGMAEPEGQNPIDQIADEGKAKAEGAQKFGEVEFVSIKKADREDGAIVITKVYGFKDINKITLSTSGGQQPMPGANQAKPLKFKYADGTLVIENESATATIPPLGDAAKNPEQLAQAREMMNGMKLSMTMNFPGGIKETTASHREGNKIILAEMDMGEMLSPENIDKMKALEGKKADEAKDVIKTIKGAKAETNEKTEIKLN